MFLVVIAKDFLHHMPETFIGLLSNKILNVTSLLVRWNIYVNLGLLLYIIVKCLAVIGELLKYYVT